MQAYSSAVTSINKNKVPRIFKAIKWQPGTINLDYGGGRFDTATEYLRTQGVQNYIYDKYNRTDTENNGALSHAPYSSVVLSNVLNVVHELEERIAILNHIKSLLTPNGTLYVSVYEGNKSGVEKVDQKRNSCQLNRITKSYVTEIASVFNKNEISIKNNIIIVKGEHIMTFTETLEMAKKHGISAYKLAIAGTIAQYGYTAETIGVETFESLCRLIETADEDDERAPLDDMIFAMTQLIEEGYLDLDKLPKANTKEEERIIAAILNNAHFIQ